MFWRDPRENILGISEAVSMPILCSIKRVGTQLATTNSVIRF